MDILELLGIPYYKKGSGIHIKKKNRGKFTDYCGGKVTQECIDKAKKSGNPTLKKRAVFAENARAWKHQKGGMVGPLKEFENKPFTPPTYPWNTYITTFQNPYVTTTKPPIDEEELANRQAWAESAGNDRAVSHRGAKGRYQIMPGTLKEYQLKTKDKGDLYDPEYNKRVRDWEFNRYKNSETVNMGNPTDSVKMGRRLAAYNYGLSNLRRVIKKANALGIDTNNSFAWLSVLPKETRDYINFTLRGQDTGAHRTNEAYKTRKK